MITPICDFCHSELTAPGGIILGPPDERGQVAKKHVCVSCYGSINVNSIGAKTQQTVLVTGSSRGIGKAIVERLLAGGDKVVAHARDSMTSYAGGSSAFGTINGDLGRSENAVETFNTAERLAGKIGGVVLNAAICPDVPFEADLFKWKKAWDEVMAVNVTANALLSKMAVEHFKKIGGGRLVFIASRTSFRGDDPERFAYAASKAALIGMARTLARGYGRDNIKVFVVAPGWTQTEMTAHSIEANREKIVSDTALGDIPKAEDVANAVAWLLSGQADKATGCTIDVNAGSYFH